MGAQPARLTAAEWTSLQHTERSGVCGSVGGRGAESTAHVTGMGAAMGGTEAVVHATGSECDWHGTTLRCALPSRTPLTRSSTNQR